MAGGRIVVFGATGYTGRLTADALVRRGQRPVLAGRDAKRLSELARGLGGHLEVAVADASRPPTVHALVGRGDVLVATVGPFVRWGHAAAEAAVRAGAHYVDCTGEPPFIRRVFEYFGPLAEVTRSGMLTAFGYDWVPGNLAGALALREGGANAVRVDTGYFITGGPSGGGMSGGTRASLAAVVAAPSFTWREGALRTERVAARSRTFSVEGERRAAVSVGSSEQFALPRLQPLREVNTYLGWFGPLSRPLAALSVLGSAALRAPAVERLYGAATEGLVKGSSGGPGPAERARAGSHIVAAAYDGAGTQLAEVQLRGVDGYSFTSEILAWGAERAAAGDLKAQGALGPVDGLGLDALEAGCAEAGMGRA